MPEGIPGRRRATARNGGPRRKVCVLVASRANYARIKTGLMAIRDHPDLELQLVVAASALLERFGRSIDVIRADGFEPDAVIHLSSSRARTPGRRHGRGPRPGR